MSHKTSEAPPYGWENTYTEGSVDYDGNEYGGRTTRRNDEIHIPAPPADECTLRPLLITALFHDKNFFAGVTGYGVACKLQVRP